MSTGNESLMPVEARRMLNMTMVVDMLPKMTLMARPDAYFRDRLAYGDDKKSQVSLRRPYSRDAGASTCALAASRIRFVIGSDQTFHLQQNLRESRPS